MKLWANQKTVERYDSTTLNNSKKLCLVQYSKKKNVCIEIAHGVAQLQAHKHSPAPEPSVNRQHQLPDLFCLKIYLFKVLSYIGNTNNTITTVTDRDDSKVKTKYSIMLRKGTALNHVAYIFPSR